ncbi:EF-hand domain-containing protein [Methylotenera sp.]|uniref:EF-hand domain-containing protein n=1 Tax=Methylotenera sp. TaxID=2051956 RepID=UPI002486EE7E|nr:EF-hand domain-containing protein [Methylotenera sp.]MDI1299542.1 EF-hand domain-containing protein [Methylotenera sp.]
MKLNTNSIIRPISASVVALLLMAGLNNLALADNAAALKDSIKTAEVKVVDMKEPSTSAKAPSNDDFNKLDANKDGNISLKEAVKDKALATQFDAADINHDGMLSADEFTSYKTASAAKTTEAAPATTTN